MQFLMETIIIMKSVNTDYDDDDALYTCDAYIIIGIVYSPTVYVTIQVFVITRVC